MIMKIRKCDIDYMDFLYLFVGIPLAIAVSVIIVLTIFG